MAENVFLENKRKLSLTEYMNYNTNDRGNLGDQLPVAVYRLMEYSIREQLAEQLGEEEQVRIFRKAGYIPAAQRIHSVAAVQDGRDENRRPADRKIR